MSSYLFMSMLDRDKERYKTDMTEARVTTDELDNCLWCQDPVSEPVFNKKKDKEYQACDKYCSHDLGVLEDIEITLGMIPTPEQEVVEDEDLPKISDHVFCPPDCTSSKLWCFMNCKTLKKLEEAANPVSLFKEALKNA